MIPEDRLQQILASKNQEEALASCTEHQYVECWAVIDGSLVVYNGDSPPAWLTPVLEARDDDGNTALA